VPVWAWILIIVLILISIGAVIVRRRCPVAFILLAGMIVSSLVFICSYRMWGQAADYLPLLWAAMVSLGASTTVVLGTHRRYSGTIGLVALLGMIVFTFVDAKERPQSLLSPDATAFVAEMDMATLPQNSVVCVAWPETPVIFYAKHILTRRDDIHIVAAATANWARQLEALGDRPMFGASMNTEIVGYDQTPYRNLWRLTRQP